MVLVIGVGILSFIVSKIRFEEDITKLVPADPRAREVQKILKAANFGDKIIVNIYRKPGASFEDLVLYASQMVDSLEEKAGNSIKKIEGQVAEDSLEATLDFLYDNAPLFLEEQDYQSILDKIQPDSIAKITEANYKTLLSPSGVVAKKLLLKDPLGISFMALKKLELLGAGNDFIVKNGFLASKDEQHILLFITPAFLSSETSENERFVNELYIIQEGLNASFAKTVESEYFGAALIAVANAQQIKTDIQVTVGITLIVLIFLFILFYRKFTVPLIIFAPTVFGGLLSIALLYAIRTEISAISLGIGSVLLGVTLDYSIHILTHIRNSKSIERLYKDISQPILMSSLTTAMAFLCLLFLDSQALQDLGIFAATSVMGASVFALLFIPQVYRGTGKLAPKFTLLDTIASFQFHKNKWLLGGIICLVILSFFTYKKVVFNKDITRLNFEPVAVTKVRGHLDKLTNEASKSVYLISYGKTLQEALEENDKIFSSLYRLKEKKEILSYNSVGAVIFSEAVQQRKIKQWQEFWTPEKVENTTNNLMESGTKLGFKTTTFHQFYTLLGTNFEPISIEQYKNLPAVSLNDFVTQTKDFTTVTSMVKVEELNAVKMKDSFNSYQKTLVVDRQEMNETLLGNLKNDFNDLIKYSSVAVLVVLLVFFRSFSLTLVTVIPIFLTWFVTIGIMGFLNIEFNIFNIIISTFIFGLGVDYAIFVTKGLLKELQTGEKAITTHKTSIILSVITTVLGIGVLIFAEHPALYSISTISIIGIFSAMVFCFVLQPLLFVLFIGSRAKRPITLGLLLHSGISFLYYGLGGILLSLSSISIMKLIPISKKIKMRVFHNVLAKFVTSVLYSNPFVKKQVINKTNETFVPPGIIIANHTSFLDTLALGMMYPKIIYLVNDWVYNSPVFGRAVKLAGFYPVSSGIENGLEHLRKKVTQGYSLMVFPEGTRSMTNKIRRFHKGAFYLAQEFNLDIIPVAIHGNSEVLPKGSFVIRSGSITVVTMDRIKPNDPSFGTTYRERAKKISTHYKEKFQEVRNQIEGANYFHKAVLLEYRYKGDSLCKTVKKDLKTHKDQYKKVLDIVGKKSKVATLLDSNGQLDFLLLLDSADRTLCSYIENEKTRKILENSFLTTNYRTLFFAKNKQEALDYSADTYIVNRNDKEVLAHLSSRNFEEIHQNDILSIFQKK